MDDLYPVARLQLMTLMQAARHDFQIHFHRQTPSAQFQLIDQLGHTALLRHLAGGTVNENLHKLLPGFLFNAGMLLLPIQEAAIFG
jgi:hypothetical protein